jgi:hypothetical protein
MWAKYSASDMRYFKTHGPFLPAMKRFKSENGNDCMAFYPSNVSNEPTEIDAYKFPDKHMQNVKKAGLMFVTGIFSKYNYRKVNGLIEDGPIHEVFANKQKKIIPIVFCHG